ncbi:unnamed protein product [Mytilus edulis]|uniref:EGF-like domain-containing protein n=1 Tax=Mytilus edulis TaxID=6550 RepID=A0A8S3S8T6_MYTED|nr:unnamed protein product [Mytilus edulis]
MEFHMGYQFNTHYKIYPEFHQFSYNSYVLYASAFSNNMHRLFSAICDGKIKEKACTIHYPNDKIIYRPGVATDRGETYSGGKCTAPDKCDCPKDGFYADGPYCRICPKIPNCLHRKCNSLSSNLCEYCDGEIIDEHKQFWRAYIRGINGNYKQCVKACSWRADSTRCYPGSCPDHDIATSCKCIDGFGGHHCDKSMYNFTTHKMADQVIKEKQQQSNIVSYFKNTPKHSAKRDQPSSSPDNSSPSMQQVEKLARLVNLDTSLSDSSLPNSDSTENIMSSVEKETVFKLSDVVCATLKNQEFMDSIIPLITEKVIEMVKPKIVQIVDECMQPHLLSIKHNKDALILNTVELNKYKEEMKMLKTKLDKVEARIEEQEQYSRRTSLRFHNVPAPTDDNGDIIKPINTDALVLDICNKNLKLNLNTRDIGRSHPIGDIKDGKIAIIVRFLSYRQRQLVFNSKRYLKGNKSKIFIAENLTKHRYDLLHRLNTLREKDIIHSFWTHDGSIIVKTTENARPKKINSRQDIYRLGGEVLEGDDQNED